MTVCASRRSYTRPWRWLLLLAALALAINAARAQEAPPLPASSLDPVAASTSTLSSLSRSELSALWYVTLAEQRQRSQADRASFEAYVASSEKAAESAMLRELSLSRTVQRLENRLQAATTAIDDSGSSATSLYDASKEMEEEAERMRLSRNVWRAGATVAAGLALLGLIF